MSLIRVLRHHGCQPPPPPPIPGELELIMKLGMGTSLGKCWHWGQCIKQSHWRIHKVEETLCKNRTGEWNCQSFCVLS